MGALWHLEGGSLLNIIVLVSECHTSIAISARSVEGVHQTLFENSDGQIYFYQGLMTFLPRSNAHFFTGQVTLFLYIKTQFSPGTIGSRENSLLVCKEIDHGTWRHSLSFLKK